MGVRPIKLVVRGKCDLVWWDVVRTPDWRREGVGTACYGLVGNCRELDVIGVVVEW